MNTTTANKTSNRRIFVLFVLLVLSSVKMFGQDVKTETAVVICNNVVAAADETTEAQMELVSWFMGVKQIQVSNTVSTSTISTNKTGKKQFINNGLTTNRILSRTFMKKAISSNSMIA